MPDRELVEDIWISARKVGNDQIGANQPLDYVSRDDSGAIIFICPLYL